MRLIATDWLPAEALAEPSFLDAMAAAISAWSLDWSADSAAHLVANPTAKRRGPPGEYKTLGLALTADWNEAGALVVAGWALGKRLDRKPLSDADRALLLSFAEAAAQDMARRVEAALGIVSGDTRSAAAMTHFEIVTSQNAALLAFGLPTEQLIRARKQQMSPPQASKSPLVPLRRALAGQSVDYSVWLGDAALSTRDIQRIEVGDVLLLKQGTGDPVDLRLSGNDDARLRAILDQDGAHFALRLCD